MKKTNFLIYGTGRLGTHLAKYFELEGLDFAMQGRATPLDQLLSQLHRASHILLCVPDKSIEATHSSLLGLSPQPPQFVHFSGALEFAQIPGAHPLAAFSPRPLDISEYRSIPFAVSQGHILSDLLPGLSNPWFNISAVERPLYHALCVLLGNGTTVLWESALAKVDGNLQSHLQNYLDSIGKNLKFGVESGRSVLTGPWTRNDIGTIQKNLTALQAAELKQAYLALMQLSGKQFQKETHEIHS